MIICRKTQIDTILKNKELILSLCESNAPGGRVHTSKAPRASNEALHDWYVLAGNLKEYLSYGSTTFTSKLTHNHCEVHCNMIIFYALSLCGRFSDIQ